MKITLHKNHTATGLSTDSLVWLWENVGVGNILPTDYPGHERFTRQWQLSDKQKPDWHYTTEFNGALTTGKFLEIYDQEKAMMFVLIWA